VQLHVPNPSNIENILKMDAEIATEEYDSALTQFLKLCVVHTHTDWDPDEMEESSQRLRYARETRTTTTKRLNDFVLDGLVPQDL
jgi:hypothetical protein